MNIYKDKCFEYIDKLIEFIKDENAKQLTKWGIQERSGFEWMTYLTEEVGELAEAITEFEYRDGSNYDIVKEAIQVSTLALKIAEMSLVTNFNKKDIKNEKDD
jgi:NTP pyrophosphatase (non-canonical NTP hydrolase)